MPNLAQFFIGHVKFCTWYFDFLYQRVFVGFSIPKHVILLVLLRLFAAGMWHLLSMNENSYIFVNYYFWTNSNNVILKHFPHMLQIEWFFFQFIVIVVLILSQVTKLVDIQCSAFIYLFVFVVLIPCTLFSRISFHSLLFNYINWYIFDFLINIPESI